MHHQYLKNLTPLRGIAALLILIFHVQIILLYKNSLTGNWETALIWRMHLMVDFFFILSGFIMFHVYGDWFRDSVSWKKFRKFTLARFARVYPLHVFTLFALIPTNATLFAGKESTNLRVFSSEPVTNGQ